MLNPSQEHRHKLIASLARAGEGPASEIQGIQSSEWAQLGVVPAKKLILTILIATGRL